MRIAGKNVVRHILAEQPTATFAADFDQFQFDGRQIARVISPVGTDQQRDHIAGMNSKSVNRSALARFRDVQCAAGKALPRRAATQLQRPRDAIAATGMGMTNLCLHVDLPGDRAIPTDRRFESWRGMHNHAVWIQVAGDADRLVRRIGNHRGCFVTPPTVNEVVPAPFGQLVGKVAVNLHGPFVADPQKAKPGAEHLGSDLMFGRQIGNRDRLRCRE